MAAVALGKLSDADKAAVTRRSGKITGDFKEINAPSFGVKTDDKRRIRHRGAKWTT